MKGLQGVFLLVLYMIMFISSSTATPIKGNSARIFRLQYIYPHLSGSTSRDGISWRHVDRLKARDHARQHRMLSDVIGFPIGGAADPFVAGLYFTQISLGTPSKNYFVQVDTGSDVLWVNCKPCYSCPTRSTLGIPINAYDPHSSLTSFPIQCEDPTCDMTVTISQVGCNRDQNCAYIFQYGDGSTTEGYLVSDTFSYDAVGYGSTVSRKDTKLIFGCSYNQSGDLLSSDRALDGILGLGQSDLSIVSQLASTGRSPKAFAHCLQGVGNGGGVLVLGSVDEPGMVHTPIIPSKLHYNVEMKGILVNGVALNVNFSAFETTNTQSTIIDSGTTLTYVSEPIYEAFLSAILANLPSDTELLTSNDDTCFSYSGSVDNSFPNVTIRFKGADMHLKAKNYLIDQSSDNSPIWCVSWQVSASNNGIMLTVIGDIVLKDKVVAYDLENGQVGWVDYDCSSSITVSSQGQTHDVIPHHLGNRAPRRKPCIIVYAIAFIIISSLVIIFIDF